MNILEKIKKNWNHKESVEQNIIRFSNEQEQKQRRIKKWYPLFIGLFVIACLVFPISPLVGLCLMIGAITFGGEYVFNAATTYYLSILVIDSTHFIIFYSDYGNSYYGTFIIGTITNGNEISFSSESVFNTGTTSYISSTLIDSTHFVVSYRDTDNSGYGTAIVGTIANGNEISFGSEYVFNADNTSYVSTYKIDTTHFVVSYQDVNNSYAGTSIIGTIANGNEISFGSQYVFNATSSLYNKVVVIDSTHFVVSYRDTDNSGYGTAIVGTIANGNEISFGSEYVFNAGSTGSLSSTLIDSTHFVVSYRDTDNSGYGTAIVGTIANGNEISFGSEYVFNAGSTGSLSSTLIDSTHFVVSYRDTDNSGYGTAIVGTIANGNEISFGSEYVFNAAATNEIFSAIIDSSNFIIAYNDAGNNQYGTAIIGTYVAPTTFIPRTMWFN